MYRMIKKEHLIFENPYLSAKETRWNNLEINVSQIQRVRSVIQKRALSH